MHPCGGLAKVCERGVTHKSFFKVLDKKVDLLRKNVNLIILAIETLVENCHANHFTLLPYDQMK